MTPTKIPAARLDHVSAKRNAVRAWERYMTAAGSKAVVLYFRVRIDSRGRAGELHSNNLPCNWDPQTEPRHPGLCRSLPRLYEICTSRCRDARRWHMTCHAQPATSQLRTSRAAIMRQVCTAWYVCWPSSSEACAVLFSQQSPKSQEAHQRTRGVVIPDGAHVIYVVPADGACAKYSPVSPPNTVL